MTTHRALYVNGRVHKVADDAHSLIVDPRILGSQHVDESGQRSTLHNLVLVVLILERQSAQSTSCCPLHLQHSHIFAFESTNLS